MDFLDDQLAGDAGFEQEVSFDQEASFGFDQEESFVQRLDGAVNQTIARAIRDAVQTANPVLQQEAASWLWTCCPDIAEQVELPEPHYDAVSTLAAAYVVGA